MNELLEALKRENHKILEKKPNLALEFDWSSDAYRLQHNEEMISKLRNLGIYSVSEQSKLLPTKQEAIEEINGRFDKGTKGEEDIKYGWIECYEWLMLEVDMNNLIK